MIVSDLGRRLFRTAGRFVRARGGASLVEFAMISPIFIVLMTGMTDLGGAFRAKMRIDTALSAGANVALLGADKLTAANAGALMAKAGIVVSQGIDDAGATVSVGVNGGTPATVAGGKVTAAGDPANADKCFCPTRSGSTITWGAAATCGSACASGEPAGKFISLAASVPYSPFFPQVGIMDLDAVTGTSIVRVQ